MKTLTSILASAVLLASCSGNKNAFDASGTFEAVETIVPAEANGTIEMLKVEEGQILKEGELVGYIDSLQLYLKKKQLEAQIRATGTKIPNITAQTQFYKQQLQVAQTKLEADLREQKRIQNLVKADAATTKQLDDINTQVEEAQKQLLVIQKQDAAQVSQLQTQTSGLRGDVLPLVVQIEQINDQLAKSRITNPINGTVLVKYVEPNEMAMSGKPLYKIADMSTIILRAYVTGDQFAKIKLNQKLNVSVDDGAGKYKSYEGTIEWISDKAEFTPKTIQTKDERANLVYAVKIRVKNDGYLKIGMYGEVKF